jgi:hypothetical protein
MKGLINTSSHDTVHQDILALLNQGEQTELFKGAYFLLQDNGLYYLKWKGLPSLNSRMSSHHSITEQFSVYGNTLSECLFGTRKINGEPCTWFQLERYSHAYTHLLPHALCFLQYRWTGQNVGPQGSSIYTEENPKILNKKRINCGEHLRLEMT